MGISGAAEAPDASLFGPQLVVAGFSTHVEIVRAHEIANEVRRVKKQLKDCQQLAMLYNNRERIFGLPITNVGLPALAHCPPSQEKLKEKPVAFAATSGTSHQLAGPCHLAGAGLNRLPR